MTREEQDALAQRASSLGFPSVMHYALALENALERADDVLVQIHGLASDELGWRYVAVENAR